jgi:hypothetical protein
MSLEDMQDPSRPLPLPPSETDVLTDQAILPANKCAVCPMEVDREPPQDDEGSGKSISSSFRE